jgi:hypothetical protein
MRLWVLLSGFLLATTVQGQVSLYEYAAQGRGAEVGLNPACMGQLAQVPRGELQKPELRARGVPLSTLGIGVNLFHYTNARVVKDLLTPPEPAGRVAVMKHSLAAYGLAGLGFYMAANPYSSLEYGSIQVRFRWDPATLVLVDKPRQDGNYLEDAYPELERRLSACGGDVLAAMLLQENGISMILYDKSSEWLVVVDTTQVRDVKVLEGFTGGMDQARQLMRKAGRSDEARPWPAWVKF